MISILSYNVNGIRAAHRKGFFDWLAEESPDVLCIQETKAQKEQLDESITMPEGYHTFWHSAEKKGYSSVAIFSKEMPKHVEYGCGIEKYDREGRILRADFEKFSIISAYFPSGTSGEERQTFKTCYTGYLMPSLGSPCFSFLEYLLVSICPTLTGKKAYYLLARLW